MNYGRYEITKEVGRGAMGVVYEAHDPQIGRVVALKVLRQDRANDEGLIKRFLREARAIGRLSHPHIVTVYDSGEDHGNVYIAMEFLEGRPLNEVLIEHHYTIQEIINIGIQVAETLHYAHEKGVVHRDIKPSNIIIQPDLQIKITDFGIARIEDSTATLQTQTGEIMGTPAYMSPEQVIGKPVDRRSDIFSLGVVLYELSTGRRPFGGPGKTLVTVFNEIMQENPVEPAVTDAPSEVPAGFSAVIMKCLSKNVDERYQTGKEVALALQNAIAAKKDEPPLPSSVSAIKKPAERRSRTMVFALIAVIVLVIAGGGAYYYYHYRAQMQPPLSGVVKPVPKPPKQALPEATEKQTTEAPKAATPQVEMTSPEPQQPSSLPVTDSGGPEDKKAQAGQSEQEVQKEKKLRQARTKPGTLSSKTKSHPAPEEKMDTWGIGELKDRKQ